MSISVICTFGIILIILIIFGLEINLLHRRIDQVLRLAGIHKKENL